MLSESGPTPVVNDFEFEPMLGTVTWPDVIPPVPVLYVNETVTVAGSDISVTGLAVVGDVMVALFTTAAR